MAKTKSNIDILKGLVSEIANHEFGTDPFNEKIEEIEEFVASVEGELDDKDSEIRELKETITGLENQAKELEEEYDYTITDSFVGLDTIRWELENGNLAIMGKMEDFIASLKKEYCATTAHH